MRRASRFWHGAVGFGVASIHQRCSCVLVRRRVVQSVSTSTSTPSTSVDSACKYTPFIAPPPRSKIPLPHAETISGQFFACLAAHHSQLLPIHFASSTSEHGEFDGSVACQPITCSSSSTHRQYLTTRNSKRREIRVTCYPPATAEGIRAKAKKVTDVGTRISLIVLPGWLPMIDRESHAGGAKVPLPYRYIVLLQGETPYFLRVTRSGGGAGGGRSSFTTIYLPGTT